MNIKNIQDYIMQVFNIKRLHTDLHCCSWEKSQNSHHKKFLPVAKMRQPKNLFGLFDCTLQSSYFNLCCNFHVKMFVEQAATNRNNRQVL